MLPEQAIEISKVRFDHAKECLRDAKLLLAGESYRSAANRAYYAIFHAMRAVLALDGVDMKHHSGIISEFRKRYIKTGVFDISLSGLSSELSDVREGSDYNDFFIVSKADTAEQVQSAGTFLTAVETYLRTNIESVRHLTQTVTQTGQKRDGRNRKIPVNAEFFHLKYAHIIIKIQKNTNGRLLTCMGSQVRVLYCPP